MAIQGMKKTVILSLASVSALTALSVMGVGCGSDSGNGIYATMTTGTLSSAQLGSGEDLSLVTTAATCTTAPKSRCSATPTSFIMGALRSSVFLMLLAPRVHP